MIDADQYAAYMGELLAAMAALDAELVRILALVKENGEKLDKISCRVGIIK